MLLVKILKKEQDEKEHFLRNQNKIVKYAINNHKYGILNSFIPTLFTMVVLSYVISFTTYSEKLTLDFLGVTLRLFQTLSTFTKSLNNVNNSQVHLEKVYEIEKNSFLPDTQNFVYSKENTGIVFDNVNFKFFNSKDYLFKNLSLNFEKNKHIILTGQNGSGKSTLLGLASGVFLPNSGSVNTFTNKYGYVGPTPLILNDSLLSNIMYGNKLSIDTKEIISYLKKLEVFKEESSYDLDLQISNKTLSSGQMQKIAFVRALMSDMEVLLLDESTSNLDDTSKDLIFELLESKNLTIVNCTHDPEKFNNVSHRYNIEISDEKRFVEQIF
jgi:ATP-binding cassette subfamily C protein